MAWGLESMPMKRRPSCWAATAVVPDPTVGVQDVHLTGPAGRCQPGTGQWCLLLGGCYLALVPISRVIRPVNHGNLQSL